MSQADPDDDIPGSTAYTDDGLFKIPRARNDSINSQSESDYIIASRTRSKVSLTETPIETIESTFRAPDVSIDMYDLPDDDIWRQFLNNFTMPWSMFQLLFNCDTTNMNNLFAFLFHSKRC